MIFVIILSSFGDDIAMIRNMHLVDCSLVPRLAHLQSFSARPGMGIYFSVPNFISTGVAVWLHCILCSWWHSEGR